MAKYRKRPIEIEAMQYTHQTRDEVIEWCGAGHTAIGDYGEEYELDNLRIVTLEGVMFANPEDWIIKGIANEFYPCKPEIFEATYEKVQE